MDISLDLDERLLTALRDDEKLSGSDQQRILQSLHAYLRDEAGKKLIKAGGEAPGMQDITRRR